MTEGPVHLFGATSILGWHLWRERAGRKLEPFCNPYTRVPACRSWRRLKLEDEAALAELFDESPPRMLIHCGGICDVDKCEAHPDWAEAINVTALETLLNRLPGSTRLVYCSSDHVFGGREEPYDETSVPDPVSIYGQSRVKAEALVRSARPDALVLRPSLSVGPSPDGRKGHLDWLRYRSSRNLPLTIVEDEMRSAVRADLLARRVLDLAFSDGTGLKHLAGAACLSRRELAESLVNQLGIDASLRFTTCSERPVPHLGRVALISREERLLPGILEEPLPEAWKRGCEERVA